jgi:hypothetical protein
VGESQQCLKNDSNLARPQVSEKVNVPQVSRLAVNVFKAVIVNRNVRLLTTVHEGSTHSRELRNITMRADKSHEDLAV